MNFKILGLCLLLCLYYYRGKKQEPAEGFAVVELFTSEGCSDCPPAEKVLSNIQSEYKGKQVYILEYHVDYFDRLGWKDTFALTANTQRQEDYNDVFKLNSVYTPQAIINGKSQMVGGDEDKISAYITDNIRKPALFKINCKAAMTGETHKPGLGQQVDLNYSLVSFNPRIELSQYQLNIAVIESGFTTHVLHGENKNKTLNHDNVVRYFKTINDVKNSGSFEVNVSHYTFAKAFILIFVQDRERKTIVAVTQVPVGIE